jgi:hypothetical protein
MDETRKRHVTAGVLVGAAVVGLAVLARRTPREQWGEAFGRVASDALFFVKSRYGATEPVVLIERTLERLRDSGEPTAMSRAFAEAALRERPGLP